MTKYFAALLMLFVAWPSFAADLNGYTALYECRAGGPKCNVDITTYTSAACAQTITTADSASTINSKLNSGGSPICVTNGDYTSKGTFTLKASGTSSSRRVLRYYRSGDTDDEPWKQSTANQAIIKNLTVSGDYWIIHRLTLNAGGASINAEQHGSYNIFSRLLVENASGTMFQVYAPYNKIQNSVFYNAGLHHTPNEDAHCISFDGGDAQGTYIVNNEIYDCTGDGIQNGEGTDGTGSVIENNDFYIDSDQTDPAASGYACSENGVDLKGAYPNNGVYIIHNRLWGFRMTETGCGGTGSYGEAIIFHDHSGVTNNRFGLVENNIIMDGTQAIVTPNANPDHWSIIGNLIYDMRGVPTGTVRSMDIHKSSNVEVYLNTSIDVNQGNSAGWIEANDDNHDIRCNVAIEGGSPNVSTGSTQIDYNVYYNTNKAGESHKIDENVTTRASSKAYSSGAVVYPNVRNNYMYEATTSGTTSSSPPNWCKALGCTVTDGSVTWQAIRGPYTFWRKLRTAPEQYTIPYVQVHISAPEANYCPSNYWSRKDVGINDSQP